jgi:dihydrodipicolinate synthase/N-acetylneuraminate lyase
VKRSRVPILSGVTHSTLDGTVRLAEDAADSGAAAVLVMPPYFFPYGQAEVREFYLRFASRIAGAIPIFLYNIPFFSSEIAVETAIGLLSTGQFAGIKDSSGNFENFLQLKALRESKAFTFLAGNDKIFARARAAGADGAVSGVASAIPELLLGIENAIARNDGERVELLDGRLQEFIRWIDRFPAPIGVKEATGVRGLKLGPPSIPLSPESQRELDEFRDWFRNWLPNVLGECGERKARA